MTILNNRMIVTGQIVLAVLDNGLAPLHVTVISEEGQQLTKDLDHVLQHDCRSRGRPDTSGTVPSAASRPRGSRL